ncbi:hypothetical protein [Nocardiopsis tropica]|jgi:hypothetical protein|uniref:Uncharacterized protein n=1 Tax=Nocardiopsis tropica TaxID=109330 RepID=A0ABU7L2K6_9ACTN|nr:hypothetical protein [Nocardiopsis umidischolae]MEE2055776.1 hypothetical protein [Nocardiopsis umidischolae]
MSNRQPEPHVKELHATAQALWRAVYEASAVVFAERTVHQARLADLDAAQQWARTRVASARRELVRAFDARDAVRVEAAQRHLRECEAEEVHIDLAVTAEARALVRTGLAELNSTLEQVCRALDADRRVQEAVAREHGVRPGARA